MSSSGTVLTSRPTTATAALINKQPASAAAASTAAINGRVTSTQVIAPPPAIAVAQTVPVLFALQFLDVEAKIDGELTTFEYSIDFSNNSSYSDITFLRGKIGGSGNEITFPYIEALNPSLANALTQQFLNVFSPDAEGNINVSQFLVGEGILPSGPDGAAGFEFNTTLDEEYIITGNLTSVASAAVPEPSSILGLLALGTLGAASTLKRKLKSSKSSEKEPTKVS